MAAPPPPTTLPTGTSTTPTLAPTTPLPPPPTTTTTPTPPPTTSTTTPIPDTTSTTSTVSFPPTTSTSSTTSTTLSLPVPTTTSSTTSTTSTTTSESTTAIVSTSGGNVVTITSVVTTSSSRNIAPTGALSGGDTSNTDSSNGFFDNRGAVAGVFTVVGLVGLAILIALIVTTIRRRRVKRFDDETAAAARDAANTQIPNFAAYADDDDDFRPGAYGTSGAKFSDASHGTYAQTPMAVPESYGMREMSPHGPNPGEYFDPTTLEGSAPAGAAGIGVARARSMRDGGYAAGLTEGASPYAAFAAPGLNPAQSQYPHGMIRGAGGPEFDLERRPSQMTQQTDYSGISRNKSYNAASSTVAPSYQSDHSYIPSSNDSGSLYSQGQQGGYPNSFNAFAASGQQRLQTIPAARSEEDLSAAYGGYTTEPVETRAAYSQSPAPGPLPNPFSATPGRPDEYDGHSDDEEEPPRRILKVANE
ncbi:hypothetical protein AGABI2DRAFT_190978 [Agaricus bisporus var. bisporus H97]|uniref:hypothetical protein n=1 Tax=Agaricus bisporus var. bisporus (strain H97 / ATCC MYA-4626 / FGSC 10389) TaxID=936046 RepID=UPI00029F5AF0|nr:hypothetical protein AGABI2DRAFT_190978 [Agaricus bisporus var. bisporus H97]EKV50748.1 hypothetical protein AGABI2DRAFT_190978 [Agaricus bisporus var. bisporus H97]